MATKRGDKSRYELGVAHTNQKKEDNFIERLVLPTDSLQGLALLYNTSIAELKKINHLHTDTDLHARRIIKVPAKGILVDLTEAAAVPLLHENKTSTNDDSDEDSTNGQVYLDNVDTVLQEIREKAESVAANSPILQGADSEPSISRKDFMEMKRKKEELAWWKIVFPCIGVLLVFPFLYYLYLEHLEHIHHHRNSTNSSNSTTPHSHSHYH